MPTRKYKTNQNTSNYITDIYILNKTYQNKLSTHNNHNQLFKHNQHNTTQTQIITHNKNTNKQNKTTNQTSQYKKHNCKYK